MLGLTFTLFAVASKAEKAAVAANLATVISKAEKAAEVANLASAVAAATAAGRRVQATSQVDPDLNLNTTEMIRSRGYVCEEHDIVTSDGFILLALRVPPTTGNPPLGVVYLQHGLVCNSAIWMINWGKLNLPLFLADAGYEVWIVNNRGRPTARHKTLPPTDPAVWAWSFDELALLDVPAAIDYILAQTGRRTISAYVGHSQGGTIGFIAFSALPAYAAKVDLFIPLGAPFGPGVLNGTVPPAILDDLACSSCGAGYPPACCHGVLGIAENATVTVALCEHLPSLCVRILCLVAGCADYKLLNASRTPILASHYPAFTSRQNVDHWTQTLAGWKHYDYGSDTANMQHYGAPTPPWYNASNLLVPTVVVYGTADRMNPASGIENYLLPMLPKSKIIAVEKVPYGHLEFVSTLDAASTLFPMILGYLRRNGRQ